MQLLPSEILEQQKKKLPSEILLESKEKLLPSEILKLSDTTQPAFQSSTAVAMQEPKPELEQDMRWLGLGDITRPFEAVGLTAAEAWNRGWSEFSKGLGEVADMLDETANPRGQELKKDIGKTLDFLGLQPEKLFGEKKEGQNWFFKFAEEYDKNAEYYAKRANETGRNWFDELIGNVLGGAAPGVTDFMLDKFTAGLEGAAEARKQQRNITLTALTQQAKRMLLGETFKAIGALSMKYRMPAMGTVFGTTTAAEGGDVSDIGRAFGTGLAYGIPGGRGMGIRELKELRKPLEPLMGRKTPEFDVEFEFEPLFKEKYKKGFLSDQQYELIRRVKSLSMESENRANIIESIKKGKISGAEKYILSQEIKQGIKYHDIINIPKNYLPGKNAPTYVDRKGIAATPSKREDEVKPSGKTEAPFNPLAIVIEQVRDADFYNKSLEKGMAEFKELREPNLRTRYEQLKKTLKRFTVDVSGNIKSELLKKGGERGKEAVIHHDLVAGASTRAGAMTEQAIKTIYDGLTKEQEIQLNKIIRAKTEIEIDKRKEGVKHSDNRTGEQGQIFLNQYFPENKYPELYNRADAFFGIMKEQLGQLRGEGLITQNLYEKLLKYDYSKTKFIQYIDKEGESSYAQSRRISVSEKQHPKEITTGSERASEMNSRLLLAEVINVTQSRISKNRANQKLFELAEATPENGIVKEAPIRKTIREKIEKEDIFDELREMKDELPYDDIDLQVINKILTNDKKFNEVENELRIELLEDARERIQPGTRKYHKAPAGYDKISVMIDGMERQMIMPTEYAREWVTRDPAINTQLVTVIGWLLGSRILKPMATGLNPEFAITNLPRDIFHAWLVADVYNPTMPIGMGQLGLDVATTFKDAVTRKGRYQEYIDEGGGMQFLTHQGRLKEGAKGTLGKIQNALGYLGETSEIMVRLAIRERALKQGKNKYEATWLARNYMDFSQGGSAIKAIDSGIPYLNAAVVGTRGIGRAAVTNPKKFIYQAAQIGALSTGLYLAAVMTNKEAWDSIPDRDKVGNWILPLFIPYTDKEGNKRWLYFKIAKDQGQRVIATAFENLMAKFMGEEVDDIQARQAIGDFLPIVPTSVLPPLADAGIGYMTNTNFWRNKDIWGGASPIESELEKTNYTDPAWIKWGEMTGLSPERSQYAFQQFATSGNIYTSLGSFAINKLIGDDEMASEEKVWAEILANTPGLRRILKTTPPYKEGEIKAIKDAKKRDNTQRHIVNLRVDKLSDNLNKSVDRGEQKVIYKEIVDYIRGLDVVKEEKDRLLKRYQLSRHTFRLPDRVWWMDTAELTPESRAIIFWDKYRKQSDEVKRYMTTTAKKVPGFGASEADSRFVRKFEELRRINK